MAPSCRTGCSVAIRLGIRFWRIAAAGLPPAGNSLSPYPHPDPEDCVTCCEECGCEAAGGDGRVLLLAGRRGVLRRRRSRPLLPASPPPPGDYQDGYQRTSTTRAQQEAALWQDPTQLPQLLDWQSSPTVRLAWCRVHNGEFQQPRRSIFGVEITPSPGRRPDFLGRTADSLTFSMPNGVAPEGYADTSAPGFRYDLATDEAVVLPQVSAWPTPATVPGRLAPRLSVLRLLRPGRAAVPALAVRAGARRWLARCGRAAGSKPRSAGTAWPSTR